MTRKEQIEKAAYQALSTDREVNEMSAFIHGAIWADSNPEIKEKKLSFDFEYLYNLYPPRPNQNKKAAFKRLASQIKTSSQYDQLQKAIFNYSNYVTVKRVEPDFIKQFSTFVNNWEEWTVPWRKTEVKIPRVPQGIPAELNKPDPRTGPMSPEIKGLLDKMRGR